MDERNIEEAMNSYGNIVLRAATSITCNRADAEDVFSDVFFALYKTNKEFSSAEHLKAWLIRAAINRAKNIRLSVWSRRRTDLNETIAAPETVCYDDVLQSLKKLKSTERAIVYLHYYEGYSFKEIGTILGLREGTVRSKVSRARIQLKELLSETYT